MQMCLNIRHRARAAGLHLLISAAVAALAAVLVFALWYPGPYRLLAGGRDLFRLVMSVDVIIGPLLTFAVFSVAKPKTELRRDLAIVGAIQIAALVYGLQTVYEARPIAMVFEVDRFKLVTASSVSLDDLPNAAPPYRTLPQAGPQLLGTRRPQQGDERNDALFKGAAGVDIGDRPLFWQPYVMSRANAVARSRPLATLRMRYPNAVVDIDVRVAAMTSGTLEPRFLPVVARGDWVAVIDHVGNVLGYLPYDGFF